MTTPAPGWYTDPSGAAAVRWWDGTTWTAHTSPIPAVPTAPVATAVPYGTPSPYVASPYATSPYQQTASGSAWWQVNRYASITFGIVAAYVALAMLAHIAILGIIPVAMALRSKRANEPLAPLALVAGGLALVMGIALLAH